MSPIPDRNDDPEKHGSGEITDTPLDVPPFITIETSSESEGEEDDEHNGYQQLPQEPDAGGDDGDNEVSNPEVTVDDVIRHELSGMDPGLGYNAPSLASTLGLPEDGLPLTESVWNGSSVRDDIPLAEEQAEKIKAAMAGFKLPDSQTPEWAKDIPEDVWKSQLKSRFNLDTSEDR